MFGTPCYLQSSLLALAFPYASGSVLSVSYRYSGDPGVLHFDQGEGCGCLDIHAACGERWLVLPVVVQLPLGLCCTAVCGYGKNH